MDYDYLADFSAIAQEKLEEWRANLAAAKDPVDQLPAEDMVRVSEIIAAYVTPESDEHRLRDGISELRNAMAASLDAGAFMTAQKAIDIILHDENIDTGTVLRSFDEAAEFLARTIARDSRARLRTEIVEGRKQNLRMSFKLGMSVRNTLRSAGFSEETLGIANLDDVWFDLLERALRAENPS